MWISELTTHSPGGASNRRLAQESVVVQLDMTINEGAGIETTDI